MSGVISATRRSLKIQKKAERSQGAERMTSALPDQLRARVPAYWKVIGYGGLSGYIGLLQPAGWVCQGPDDLGRPDG
jgi:hypothetical protein